MYVSSISSHFTVFQGPEADGRKPAFLLFFHNSVLHLARQQQAWLLRAVNRASSEQVLHPLLCQ